MQVSKSTLTGVSPARRGACPIPGKPMGEFVKKCSGYRLTGSREWTIQKRQCPRHTRCPARAMNSDEDRSTSPVPGFAHHIATFLACGALLSPYVLEPAEVYARSFTTDEQRTVSLFKRNTPSVVNVTNLGVRQDVFTLDVMEIPQGAGSGVVWDSDGHVVTNFHVIKEATEVQITLSDGKQFPAKVVGIDIERDVVVLKINSDAKLVPVAVGRSSDLVVGQRVFAIGNPFGLDHTLTTGVISGIGREIGSGTGDRPLQDVIQTDAAINPGNSGGPLLDSGGNLIGLNTAIFSPSGASSGVGFAIPVDVVKSSVDQIIKYGRVVRPIIGISFATDQSVAQLGVQGILVLRTREGSPADKAGIKGTSRDEYGRLQLGDIIVAMNGQKVRTSTDLYRVLDKCKVGDQIDIQVLRQTSEEHVELTLEASP